MPATPAWPPRSTPRLFVEPALAAGQDRVIEGPQAHYLANVMRLEPGDPVIVCDDATGEWAALVERAGRRSVELTVIERLRVREAVPDVVLAPALLKKDRFDLVIEKATELGATRIAPWIARRSVARDLNAERARRIMIEAAEQCARTALTAIDPPRPLDALLCGFEPDRALFVADEEGGAPALAAFQESSARAALILGPEGGFDPDERALLRAHPQVRPITLGPRILRGETAAIAALALWMGVVGDWGGSPPAATRRQAAKSRAPP